MAVVVDIDAGKTLGKWKLRDDIRQTQKRNCFAILQASSANREE